MPEYFCSLNERVTLSDVSIYFCEWGILTAILGANSNTCIISNEDSPAMLAYEPCDLFFSRNVR